MLVLGHLDRFNHVSKEPIFFQDKTKGHVLELRSCPDSEEILWKIEMTDIQFTQFNFSFPGAIIVQADNPFIFHLPIDPTHLYSLLSKNEKEKINYLIYFSGGKVSEGQDNH